MDQLNIFTVNHGCPDCGETLDYSFSCTYNNVRMCIQCAYNESPVNSPAREQFERNYGSEVKL